jgi:hypothetical protein
MVMPLWGITTVKRQGRVLKQDMQQTSRRVSCLLRIGRTKGCGRPEDRLNNPLNPKNIRKEFKMPGMMKMKDKKMMGGGMSVANKGGAGMSMMDKNKMGMGMPKYAKGGMSVAKYAKGGAGGTAKCGASNPASGKTSKK